MAQATAALTFQIQCPCYRFKTLLWTDKMKYNTSFLVVLIAIVGQQQIAAELEYDVASLNTFDVAQVKEKIIPNDTIGKNLKLICSNFAFGIFKLLGLQQADVLRDGFLVRSGELFDKLEQWAMTGNSISESFKWSLAPLFRTCSNELMPKPAIDSNESSFINKPKQAEEVLENDLESKAEDDEAKPKLGGTSKWDFDELETFQYSKAMRAANNPDPVKYCTKFSNLVLGAYDEVHTSKEPKLIELYLELSLRLSNHFDKPSTKSGAVATNVARLASECSEVFAEMLIDKVQEASQNDVDETTKELIKVVYPEWELELADD